MFAATPVESPRALLPQSLSTPAAQAAEAPTDTLTAEPFTIEFTPLPSETPLPTLELPTEVRFPPELQIWDGLPTYLSESKPDFYFRLRFDPDTWALTVDNFGFPALAHRSISDCSMSSTSGHGLPLNVLVEHEKHHIGSINYDIATAYLNGVKQFVSYAGGDLSANIYTAFQVSFADQPDRCLADAEDILTTLTSVPVSQATPIPTP
jgi:hypothetical protein